MGRASIDLLGGFAAHVDGEAVPGQAWRLRKARELVKILALAPQRRMHREQLMDLLWRELQPGAAANNLNQVVHVARKAIGAEAIVLHDEVLRLEADVDVDAFESAARHALRIGSGRALRAALELYTGELLPENRYDDWADRRRVELEELRSQLEDRLAEAPSALPFLPADVSSFVGRARELKELRALLGRGRLLTLSGTGGVGKTRLALELARSSRETFPDGQTFIDLAPVADSRLVVEAVARVLDVRAVPGLTTLDAVVDFLADRKLLLVIDNCEHLLSAAAEACATLLRRLPRLTVVATSREPLRVPGEIVFRVPSLGIPDPEQEVDPGRLLRYESVRLFVDRAEAVAPEFVLDASNARDVAIVCSRLDGLPLALELAAGRAAALTPAALAERLGDRFNLLRAATSAAPTRQQTLAATLQWSYELLDNDEQALFRRLSAFAGTFDLEAVEAVCVDPLLPLPTIADVLGRLVEKSLVALADAGGRGRYRLLETVRSYSSERLAEAGENDELRLRHARWAMDRAGALSGSPLLDVDGDNMRAALDTLLESYPQEALRFCVLLGPHWLRRIDLAEASRRFDEALEGAPGPCMTRVDALLAAASIHGRAGLMARGESLAEAALELARHLGDPAAELRAVFYFAMFGIGCDRMDAAEEWAERGLSLARANDLRAAEATFVYTLAVARWLLGDLDRAESLAAQSAGLFAALEGSGESVTFLMNMSEMRTVDPVDRPGLRVVFEDTLIPFVPISCEAAVGYVLANQASIARVRGDLTAARRLLTQSASRFEELDDDRGRADVRIRRGYLALAEGTVDEAREHFAHALALRRRIGDVRGTGLTLTALGLAETIAGRLDTAERYLDEAWELFRRAVDRWGRICVLWRRADLECARGRFDAADRALEESLTVLAETGRPRWSAHSLAARAEVALLQGDVERARELFGDARDIYLAARDRPGAEAINRRLDSVQSPR